MASIEDIRHAWTAHEGWNEDELHYFANLHGYLGDALTLYDDLAHAGSQEVIDGLNAEIAVLTATVRSLETQLAVAQAKYDALVENISHALPPIHDVPIDPIDAGDMPIEIPKGGK